MLPAIVRFYSNDDSRICPDCLSRRNHRSLLLRVRLVCRHCAHHILLVAMLVIPAFAFMGWKEPKAKAITLEPLMKPFLQSALSHKKQLSASLSFSLLWQVSSLLNCRSVCCQARQADKSPSKWSSERQSALSSGQGSKNVEDVLHNNPKVASYSAAFGSTFTPKQTMYLIKAAGYIQQPNVANLSVTLKNNKEVNTFIPALQTTFSSEPNNVAITVTNQSLAGDDSQIKIMLTGADETTLESAAGLIRVKLADIKGLSVSGKTDLTNGIPKYAIVIDKAEVEKAGVKADDINKLLARYMTKGKDFDISTSTGNGVIPVDVYIDPVKSGPSSDKTLPVYTPKEVLASLAGETITGADGQTYRLDQFVAIHESTAAASIQERDGQPISVVTAQIITSDISKVSKSVDQTLKQNKASQRSDVFAWRHYPASYADDY